MNNLRFLRKTRCSYSLLTYGCRDLQRTQRTGQLHAQLVTTSCTKLWSIIAIITWRQLNGISLFHDDSAVPYTFDYNKQLVAPKTDTICDPMAWWCTPPAVVLFYFNVWLRASLTFVWPFIHPLCLSYKLITLYVQNIGGERAEKSPEKERSVQRMSQKTMEWERSA